MSILLVCFLAIFFARLASLTQVPCFRVGIIETFRSEFEIGRLIHFRHGGAERYRRIGFRRTLDARGFDDIVAAGNKGGGGGEKGDGDEDREDKEEFHEFHDRLHLVELDTAGKGNKRH